VSAWARLFCSAVPIPPRGTRVDGLKSGHVHSQFKAWAEAAGYRKDHIPAVNGFVQRLCAAVPGVETRHTVSGNILVGLELKENSNEFDARMASEDDE